MTSTVSPVGQTNPTVPSPATASTASLSVRREPVPFDTQPVTYRLFYARIVGETPLLMHSPRGMKRQETRQASRKEVPPPEEEAEMGLYRAPEGYLYLAWDHLREAMLRGAIGFSVKLNRNTPLRRVLAGALLQTSPYFPLLRDGKPITQPDRIDIRRVVVQNQGIMRARGLIDTPWECLFSCRYDASTVRPEPIVAALSQAGRLVGLLEYRPERGGSYGRFSVVEAWVEDL